MHQYTTDLRPAATLEIATVVVKRCLDSKWQGRQQQVDAVGCRYVLFFDGGSRGNPGPGGAGAVIVRLGIREGQYHVVWAASMSYAAVASMNNYAENMGLLTGIRTCVEHGFTPVHVVGDSLMIINQHSTRRPPKASHLKPLYWKCRRGLASVTVLIWSHHLRNYNKMADSMANLATKQSKQALRSEAEQHGPRWGNLPKMAEGDMGHWALTHGGGAV
jgi:ribonuclease HI